MEKSKKKKLGFLSKFMYGLTAILVLACLVKIFVVDIYTVRGTSMSPTYFDGQTVFASKVSAASRTDVVVIKAESYLVNAGMEDTNIKFLFKRVVAVGGDKIWMEDGWLVVYFDGWPHKYVDEQYNGKILSKMTTGMVNEKNAVVVPEGWVYVLGDNRQNSSDSRVFGCVKVSDIEAVCVF